MELFSKYWGCHQIPERSYFFLGYQLPVCARCEGMIIGELIAVILIFTGFGIKWFYCLIMFLPMLLDGIIQYKTAYTSTNIKRLLTGFLFGVGFIYFIFDMIKCVFL
ncbi:MAG: DUF2085 domain-containing protein [Clostridium sp.]|nr:DUF2085 domain-containing protein [Clostridium sp.]